MGIQIAPPGPGLSQAASGTAYGIATAPAGTTAICTIAAGSLPAGTYAVEAAGYLDGTIVPGTDDDNFRITIGGVAFRVILVPGVAGVIGKYGPFYVTFTGAQNITLSTVVAGSASATYHAQLTATQVGV